MKGPAGEGPNQAFWGGERPVPQPGESRGREEACARGWGKAGVGGAWKHSPGPGGGKRCGAGEPAPGSLGSLSGPQCERRPGLGTGVFFVLMDILKNTQCTGSKIPSPNIIWYAVWVSLGVRPVTSIWRRDCPGLSHIGNIIDLKTFLFKL